MVTYTWIVLNSTLMEHFHICPKRNYRIKDMILILINETLRIFFYGTQVTTMEFNTMTRTLETVLLGGIPKTQLWQCFFLMVIMIFMWEVLIYVSHITKCCAQY